jgi:subtilisin family serine protease
VSVNPSAYSPSDILVQYKPGQAAFALPGTTVGQQLSLVNNLYEINLAKGVSVPQALAQYSAAGVVSAEPDYILSDSAAPNTPNFNQQWALQNTGQNGGTPGDDIGAVQAWSTASGAKPIVVAVADTGVDYDQPDLYQNIWINQADIPASRLKNLVDVYHDGYISMRDLNSPVNQGPGKIEDLNGDGYIDAGDLLQPMVLNARVRTPAWAAGSIPRPPTPPTV